MSRPSHHPGLPGWVRLTSCRCPFIGGKRFLFHLNRREQILLCVLIAAFCFFWIGQTPSWQVATLRTRVVELEATVARAAADAAQITFQNSCAQMMQDMSVFMTLNTVAMQAEMTLQMCEMMP